MPADDILMIVSEMGLEPSNQVQQRGAYYVVHAVDPRSVEVRVVADMRSGTILSVIPLQSPEVQASRYNGSAQIIHVPRPDGGGAKGPSSTDGTTGPRRLPPLLPGLRHGGRPVHHHRRWCAGVQC